MTKNHKFMLSMAAIAILSGTNLAAKELKIANDKLTLGDNNITISNGRANVTPATGEESEAIEVKSEIKNPIGTDKMTNLSISAPQAELKIGDGSTDAKASIGSTKDDTTNGYGFTIDASKVTLTGKDTSNNAELNVNQNSSISTSGGTTLNANSAINIAAGKTLTINSGGLTSNASSTISIGSGSTLSVSGELSNSGGGTISLGGGTLTANGKATLDGTKLTLTDGGTLNFNGGSGQNASTISGAVSSTANKALNINLSRGTELKFSGSLTLNNKSGESLDKISLGGGSLSVGKLDADSTNFLGAGTINFTDQTNAQTAADGSKITNDYTIGSGTALNLGKNVHLTLGGKNQEGELYSVTTRGSKITFSDSTSTLNVSNLSANASDFDMSNGGKLIFAANSKSNISGNAALGENGSYVFSAAGTLDLDSLALTKTGNIEFASKDSVLNLKNGMSAEDASKNIKISAGGTINFNGGNSLIKGTLATTAQKDTLLNINSGAGVSFEGLTLADAKSILTLNGGTVNVGALTTKDKANLDLKNGTLNFSGVLDEKGELITDSGKSSLTGFLDSVKSAGEGTIINFNYGSEVSIISASGAADLNLAEIKANLNFNAGSLVKLGTDSKGTLTQAAGNNLNLNGQIELGKLVSQSSADSSLVGVNFLSAGASLSGNLVGKDTTKITIGTDKEGNNIIGASGEKVEIGEAGKSSALTLKYGEVGTNAALTTTTDSKLIFGGGSLNIGAGGSLTIADTDKNLEFKEGAGGWLTLGAKGDSAKGGEMTITAGNIDLSKTSMGISIENGGKLTTTAASKISGNGNLIALSNYSGIRVYGDITTAAGGTFEYEKMGDLTLGKDTTLGIFTLRNADGDLQEITAGKFDATNGATLAFGNGGAVKLTGKTTDTSLKLNNVGFGSNLTLADKSVLEFAGGSVDVKGALGVEASKTATLKVTGANANLNGGFATTDYIKTIELDSGTLHIKQDSLTAEGLDVMHIQRNSSGIGSAMDIDGSATISTSKFAILPLVETGATSYKVLSTTKGLTISDLNQDKGTTGEFRTRNSLNAILGKYGLSVDTTKLVAGGADKVISAKDGSVTVTLRNDGKNLFLERQLTNLGSLAAVKQAKIQADIDMLNKMAENTEIVEADKKDNITKLATELTTIKNNTATRNNVELAAEMGGGHSDILLSAFGVSSGATDSATRNAIILDIMETGGAGIVQDIKDGATSSSNMSSSTSSVVNTMNLSNDMAISGRIAQANNPYANYASFDGLLFAALDGDFPLYYANNGYMNGFWANAIGGLNQVEGESGSLMGLSFGFDRQLENTLVGFFMSYAMANLNDKVVEQSADNIQVGIYTSFNQRDIEVNVKAYGQLAVTETTARRGGEGEATAKFNRLYAGISANIGTIFEFNRNSTFIKPYIGENYYYAHTPAYEETKDSTTALSVQSANNHALSFDVGVDIRQYWNQNSFVYITPSIERYVVNSGGDYTAGFIGSDTTFTIEGKSKTKTYLQTLLGGNIALGDKFNVNVGLGVKKILSGQIERDNGDKIDELYLSGNLGVKYRF